METLDGTTFFSNVKYNFDFFKNIVTIYLLKFCYPLPYNRDNGCVTRNCAAWTGALLKETLINKAIVLQTKTTAHTVCMAEVRIFPFQVNLQLKMNEKLLVVVFQVSRFSYLQIFISLLEDKEQIFRVKSTDRFSRFDVGAMLQIGQDSSVRANGCVGHLELLRVSNHLQLNL